MEVYINHLDKSREDFKKRFGDLDNVQVSEWLAAPFDMKTGYESDLKDSLIEMHADVEAKALVKSENIAEY